MKKHLFQKIIFTTFCMAFLIGSAQADLRLGDATSTGQWFNPARNGEGFWIEISSNTSGDQTISVAMYSFDENGNQLWLVGSVGIAAGDIGATIPVILVEGPVWGVAYDPADQDTTQFGTIVVRFPTCDSALFSVTSNVPVLESGTYSLVRLTNVTGLDCVEPPPPDTPDPPPAGGITPGLWAGVAGANGEYETCFFVNAEGTQVVETDECDQGKAFSSEIPGVQIDIDGRPDVDDCVASVICDATWSIDTTTDANGIEVQQMVCVNEVGGIGQVIFDTDSRGRARTYEGVDPDGRLCYGPDVEVRPVGQ